MSIIKTAQYISILYPFEAFNDFLESITKSYTSYDFIISFQTFCANQSSNVVEVQSQAENDWLITLSKKCSNKKSPDFLF